MSRKNRLDDPTYRAQHFTQVRDVTGTLEEFRKREEREAKERNEASVKQVLSQVNQTWQKLDKALGAFWGQHVSDLVVAGLWKSDAGLDLAFSVPAIKESFTVPEIQAAFETWFKGYNGPHQFAPGTKEKPNRGGMRLVYYAMNQALNGQQDISNPAAFEAAHNRLVRLGAYAPDEIIYDASKAPAAPEPEPAKPVLSERAQVELDFWESAYPLVSAWAESLRVHHGKELTREDCEYLFGTSTTSPDPMRRGWFFRANKSPHSRKSFDEARLHCIAAQRKGWTEAMRTADEQMALDIESKIEVPLDRLSHTDRAMLRNNLDILRGR